MRWVSRCWGTFVGSYSDGLVPLSDAVLDAVGGGFGECLLLDAHARDYVVGTRAKREESRRTQDIDFAIAVPDLLSYRSRTSHLQRSPGTGIRFLVEGIPVDLIPFAPTGALAPLVEVEPGSRLTSRDWTRLSRRLSRTRDLGDCGFPRSTR